MTPVVFDLLALIHLLVAALSGLAVGVEREWSGHASGPNARLGGMRTFTMLGALAGVSGWLWFADVRALAVVLLSAAAALIAIGYANASRRDIDGTTEVAGIVVLAAGVLAGMGLVTVAMGITAIMVLLLLEKTRLHGWVAHINDEGIAAGARFAVMALVVLPLLPAGAYGPYDAIRPRELWALVLFFSGLSFISYVVRRAIGMQQGYAVSGILGGFISSTSVTLTMSKLSQGVRSADGALAAGLMGANAMMFLRVSIAAGVLAPVLPAHLAPLFIAPFLIALLLTVWGMRTKASGPAQPPHGENPLEFRAALKMALLFQLVLIGLAAVRSKYGNTGVYGSAAVLGLTDMDALTLSMAKSAQSGTAVRVVVNAITIGILANTAVKTAIVMVIGRGKFRLWAGAGLLLLGLALGGGLWFAFR
jgi:uncharacterized membrane protein (DUF4010 family)